MTTPSRYCAADLQVDIALASRGKSWPVLAWGLCPEDFDALVTAENLHVFDRGGGRRAYYRGVSVYCADPALLRDVIAPRLRKVGYKLATGA